MPQQTPRACVKQGGKCRAESNDEPELPRDCSWTKDATGQCLRQLHQVQQCSYRHDGQHDIFFLKTIFFQAFRTRGAIPFSASSLCSQWCWRCKECLFEIHIFMEVTECNYEICLAGIVCWFLQTHQLWKFTRSHLQSGFGGKKSETICELHSFFFLWLHWPLV